MAFQTNTAEAMRIDSSGNVGINDSDPSEGKLSVVLPDSANHKAVYIRNQDSTNDPVTLYLHNESGVAGDYIECFLGGVGTTMVIQSDGDGYNTNGTWGTISDERLKENVVDATPKLDEINKLNVRNFNFISSDLKQIGFIAQEIEKVFPTLVTEDKGIKEVVAKDAIYETVEISPAIEAKDAVMDERQVVVVSEVEEEVSSTEIVLEDGKYVQKTTTETVIKEVSEPQYEDAPLYDEDGEEIGTHRIPVMEEYESEAAVEAVDALTEERLVSKAVEAVEGREPMKRVKSSILIPILVKAVQELSAKVEALENA